MNFTLIPFLLVLIIACDPYDFGYQKNPAYVLDNVLKSITTNDAKSFSEVTAEEALCLYGNPAGLEYLQQNVKIKSSELELKWKNVDAPLNVPVYVGFWSYFNSRFVIDINIKQSATAFAQAIVDCHFGINGPRDERYLNLRPGNYLVRECRLIKLIPESFSALAMSEKCLSVKVD